MLDITNFAFRAIHAAPRTPDGRQLANSAGVVTGGAFLFARMLLSFLQEHKPTHLVAVWDAPARSFRKDLSPDYKANRGPLDPTIKSQLKLCRAVVKALPLPVLQVPGVEADDVMATLALRCRQAGFRAVIVTSDKDLHVMVGANRVEEPESVGVDVYDPMKRAYVDVNAVREKWGVYPVAVSDLLALTGDATDNVKGVAGVGPKTAAGWLERWGTLAGVVAHAGEVTGKRGEALRAAVADGSLELSRQLTALKLDVEIPVGPADLAMPPPDLEARSFLFKSLEFTSLLPEDAMPTLAELQARRPVFDAQGRRT